MGGVACNADVDAGVVSQATNALQPGDGRTATVR